MRTKIGNKYFFLARLKRTTDGNIPGTISIKRASIIKINPFLSNLIFYHLLYNKILKTTNFLYLLYTKRNLIFSKFLQGILNE